MVPPYYNRPSQEGIVRHFAELANDAPLPIILYNVPGRTVTDIQPATLIRVVQAAPEIFVGVKDATGALARVSHHRSALGPDFCQLSGNDDLALAFNAMGGVGCISVTANVAPRLCAEFQVACLRGDYATALDLQDKLMPLHTALFLETNPAPAKYALSLLGKCEETVRLPMVAVAEPTRAAVREAMVHAGLIN